MELLVNFNSIPWESPIPGIRQKSFIKGKEKLRLVEFSQDFVEPDWCVKGHVGYVISGCLFIEFANDTKQFKAGDGIWIPEGNEFRHKGSVADGEKALVVLFESESI